MKNTYRGEDLTPIDLQPTWTIATGNYNVHYSQPTLMDNVLYVGTYTQSSPQSEDDFTFYALDMTTGEYLWSLPMSSHVLSSLAINGTIYVLSHNELCAVDPSARKRLWSLPLNALSGLSLRAFQNTLYASSAREVYAIDAATGRLQWTYTCARNVYAVCLVADLLVLGVSYGRNAQEGALIAIDAVTGKKRWSFPAVYCLVSSVVQADGVVYSGAGNGVLRAFAGATGEELWSLRIDRRIRYGPTLANKRVYVGSWDGKVRSGQSCLIDSRQDRGTLHAIDPAAQQFLWSLPFQGMLWTAPLAENDRLYACATDGRLHVIDAMTGKRLYTMLIGAFLSLIVQNSTAFIVNGNKLYALHLPENI